MAKALSQEDKDLSQVTPADVFDPALKAPRAYTAISTSFKSIATKGYTLYFEQETVQKLADPVLYEKTIKQGRQLKEMTLAEMDVIWDEAKRIERQKWSL